MNTIVKSLNEGFYKRYVEKIDSEDEDHLILSDDDKFVDCTQMDEAAIKKPKDWNSLFATKVIDAYNNGDLTEDNIEKWETEYNGGIKPYPSLGTTEILKYYIKTKKDPRNESISFKRKRRRLKESDNYDPDREELLDDLRHDVYNALKKVALKYKDYDIEFTSNEWDDAYNFWGDVFFISDPEFR